MTTLYLGLGGHGGTAQQASLLAVTKPVRPSILVSFHYLPAFERASKNWLEDFKHNQLMLDSGAYTAMTLGKAIDIDKLTAEVKTGRWKEAAALDVVGDPEASLRNARYMKAAGADAFPTFHFGEPWSYLETYCREFGKVGLGGIVPIKSVPDRMAWLDEVFARAWPKKFHLFGWLAREPLMRWPFHSADSCGWEMGPACFGTYSFASGQNLGLNRKKAMTQVGATYMKPEVEMAMRLQAEVRLRWREEFRRQGWS